MSSSGNKGSSINPHEKAFVRAFVEPSRQERFLGFLSDPRKRRMFLDELPHPKPGFLSAQYVKTIPGRNQHASELYALLTQLGAGERCWVISEGKLDGREMALREALQETVGSGMGTIISCIPGKLAFFESEDGRDDGRFILQR